jgi:tight adherence protein B
VTASPAFLVTLLAVGLMLMGLASVALLRLQARQEEVRLRYARVLSLYQRQGAGLRAAPTSGVGFAATAEGLGPMLAGLFGFDPELGEHYVLRWWMALAATLIIAVMATKLGSGLLGKLAWFGLPLVWIVLSRGFFNWCRRRRADALFQQFPDALAMIVRAVRVGIPVTDSITAVGRELEAPTGPEFARLSDELAIGMTLEDALRAMAERNKLQEYRFFATALSLQSQTGGGLSETLENLGDVIRKRVGVKQKGEALSSEAKMSSIVLGVLPPLAAVGLYVMNSAYIVLLFVDPLGQKILAGAVLMLGLGIMSMKTMIRKSLS